MLNNWDNFLGDFNDMIQLNHYYNDSIESYIRTNVSNYSNYQKKERLNIVHTSMIGWHKVLNEYILR